MEKIEEIPWVDDIYSNTSTSLPEVIFEEKNQLGTLIIFVVLAVLTITLLFVVAIFIDCRQEKLSKMPTDERPKRMLNIIPKFLRNMGEDEEAFAEKMQVPDDQYPTSSNYVV